MFGKEGGLHSETNIFTNPVWGKRRWYYRFSILKRELEFKSTAEHKIYC